MVDIVFNVAERALAISYGEIRPSQGIIVAKMAGHNGRQLLNGLSMGVTINVNGNVVAEKSYPPAGQVVSASTQDEIVEYLLQWSPDWTIGIDAWCEEGGDRFTASTEFTIPRPAQPFASWTWDGNQNWQPPVAYPEDGLD